jgi:hypothetical protein
VLAWVRAGEDSFLPNLRNQIMHTDTDADAVAARAHPDHVRQHYVRNGRSDCNRMAAPDQSGPRNRREFVAIERTRPQLYIGREAWYLKGGHPEITVIDACDGGVPIRMEKESAKWRLF